LIIERIKSERVLRQKDQLAVYYSEPYQSIRARERQKTAPRSKGGGQFMQDMISPGKETTIVSPVVLRKGFACLIHGLKPLLWLQCSERAENSRGRTLVRSPCCRRSAG
jgi:hypothetical protein